MGSALIPQAAPPCQTARFARSMAPSYGRRRRPSSIVLVLVLDSGLASPRKIEDDDEHEQGGNPERGLPMLGAIPVSPGRRPNVAQCCSMLLNVAQCCARLADAQHWAARQRIDGLLPFSLAPSPLRPLFAGPQSHGRRLGIRSSSPARGGLRRGPIPLRRVEASHVSHPSHGLPLATGGRAASIEFSREKGGPRGSGGRLPSGQTTGQPALGLAQRTSGSADRRYRAYHSTMPKVYHITSRCQAFFFRAPEFSFYPPICQEDMPPEISIIAMALPRAHLAGNISKWEDAVNLVEVWISYYSTTRAHTGHCNQGLPPTSSTSSTRRRRATTSPSSSPWA
jgi:hypothetical protein